MEEKRRLKRRYLLAEVKLRPRKDEKWTDAVLMNINRGGIGLYASGPLRSRSKVVVKIIYLEGRKKRTSEEIPAVVKWTQSIGKHYAAGVKFEEKINKKNFPVLSKCLTYAKCNK